MDEETRLVRAELSRALADPDTIALNPVAVYELASKVVVALDVIEAIIPDLRTPHPSTAKRVRGARTVPREAVIAIVAMVDAWPSLRNCLNLERAHEVIEHDHNFRVLGDRMERLRKQVSYTLEARWAEVTEEAMAAYHMAKVYAKQPKNAALAQHIAVIRGHLDRTNGRTAKKKNRNKA